MTEHSHNKKRIPFHDCTRREFITRSATLGVALSVSPFVQPSSTRAVSAATPSTLSVVSGERARATRKAVQMLGGMERYVARGNRVVLKPNMSFPHPPQRATNTHPEVVAAIARMCLEAGAAEVLVLDYPFNRPGPCLKFSGIKDACSGMKKVYVLAITDKKLFRQVPVPKGKVLREVQIMRDVLESDVLINIPTAKSHTTTGVSLGMKGLMGVIWDRGYFHAKVDINQAIADLSTAVKVDLVVLDASRALVTGGPTGPGTVAYPGSIVAGTDPVAVDAMGVTMARWYGQQFSGDQVKHIADAAGMGLGTLDMEKMRVLKAKL